MTVIVTDKYPTAVQVRQAARTGQFSRVTDGQAPSQVQANLIVLPKKYADDFRILCERNPVPCCLLGESTAPGAVGFDAKLAKDIDITTDAPGYNVYEDGKLVAHDIPDIREYWKEDSVAFLIGCSFTFEDALHKAGLIPRHAETGKNVPMYKTSYKLLPAGVFEGNMVVSMRPYPASQVELVRSITRPYVRTHGEPVAWGWEGMKALGIDDISKVDFGDAPDMKEGEVPVFWGCGVTPQLSVMGSPNVKGLVLGHAPGKMICLDLQVKDII